jgi:putative protease
VAARIRLALYADSTEVVTAAAAAGCDAVYFEPRSLVLRSHCDRPGRCTADPGEIKTAAEICAGAGTRLVWKLPRITHQDELDAILRLTGDVVRYGISGIMAENPGAAYAVRRHRPGIPLYGSAGLNVFNHVAVRQLAPDFCHLTLSPELSHCDLTALMNRVAQMDHLPALELIVQGNIEAMVSEDCLASPFIFPEFLTGTQEKAAGFTGIRDARGYIFPFYTDASCRTHILNTKELCLIDHLPAIREIGIGSVAIDARNKTGRYAADMVSCYTEAVRAVPEQDRDMRERLHDLKSQVKRISAGGITAGHFVRDPAGAKR